MSKSEQAIRAAYAKAVDQWTVLWRRIVTRQLAEAARRCIESLTPLRLNPRIVELQQPDVRAGVITTAAAVPEIVHALAAPGAFRDLAQASCAAHAVGLPSRTKLEQMLTPLVTESLGTNEATAQTNSIQDFEIYRGLADILSEELFQIGNSGAAVDENLVLDHALLVYHLRHCRIPLERLAPTLTELSIGISGLTGHLISIQNHHLPSNNTDDFQPPVTAFIPPALSEPMQAHSDLLRAIQQEATSIRAENGYFHRSLNRRRPVVPELLAASPLATQEIVELGRGLMYPQYEHTALLFMSLAGIDFLLRSHPPEQVPPDKPLERIIRDQPGISAELRGALERICSSDAWNIRNRCMHGSFLEIEARREELLRNSGILARFGVPTLDLSQDESLPASVSALTLNTLNSLAQELEPAAGLYDRSWTAHYVLTPEELEFANTVPCDLLRTLEEGEAWRRHIRDYLRVSTPCLSVPLQIGMTSWLRPAHGPDTMPGFYFLALLFEPFLRLTLHFGGNEILQKGISNRGGAAHYRVQYRMLDENGFISPGNITWLTNHLEPHEKVFAERVLRLAVKCRDAVAHGAVYLYTEEIRRIYGHLLIKGMQLVIEAGLNHLDQTGRIAT
jgi:hypothetical protein